MALPPHFLASYWVEQLRNIIKFNNYPRFIKNFKNRLYVTKIIIFDVHEKSQVDSAETVEIAESAETFISLPNQIFTSHYNLCPWCYPYLELFFQISKKTNLPPIPLIHSVERIRGMDGNF